MELGLSKIGNEGRLKNQVGLEGNSLRLNCLICADSRELPSKLSIVTPVGIGNSFLNIL